MVTTSALVPDAPDAAAATVALARVDWRFLLDEPTIAKAAYIGAPDEVLLAGLGLVAASVAVNPPPATGQQGHDLVVVSTPSHDALRSAALLLRPGGQVYVELRRSPSPLLRTRDCRTWRRRLLETGFTAPGFFWHVPTFDAATHIVPLRERAALRVLARRHQGSLSGALKAGLLTTTTVTGTTSLVAGDVSIVARRAGVWGAS